MDKVNMKYLQRILTKRLKNPEKPEENPEKTENNENMMLEKQENEEKEDKEEKIEKKDGIDESRTPLSIPKQNLLKYASTILDKEKQKELENLLEQILYFSLTKDQFLDLFLVYIFYLLKL